MSTQGRNTDHNNRGKGKLVKELLRQMLFLVVILLGIVASSLPIALLFGSGDSAGTESQKASEASDAATRSILSDRQQRQRLTVVNDTNRPQHQKRRTAN